MANTLHDNIVVKSKPKAPTEKEDKLTLLKHDCGQAIRGIKSQPLSLISSQVSKVETGTDISGISTTDVRVLGKKITQSTVLKNVILDLHQGKSWARE